MQQNTLFATGKNDRNVWFVLPSFLLQLKLVSLIFYSSPPHPYLFFFSFYVLHSYFLTVKHCIGVFFFFNLQIIFILLFLQKIINFDCIFVFSKLLHLCSLNVHIAAQKYDCGGKKKNFKNPHFLLRRKHLTFIYLCMEDT